MENLKNLFVPFEIAKILKEKGFDKPCFYAYKETPKHLIAQEGEMCLRANGNPFGMFEGANYNISKKLVSAPLYQQVIDWFEEKHQIFINYDIKLTETHDYYGVVEVQMDYELHKRFESGKFPNKHQALSKAIEDALTLLVFMTVN